MTADLVIAAHGSRDPHGAQMARELTDRVAGMLPDVNVHLGFIELSEPSIPEALDAALETREEGDQHVVVVPLMLGNGNHVRIDIPEFLQESIANFPEARIDYAAHLGPDEALHRAVDRQLEAARGDWEREDTTVVFVGRGTLVPQANADHMHLARMHQEVGGWQEVVPCFIQVTGPSLPEALDRCYSLGARQIVVMGHWLFPGRLRSWTREQTYNWSDEHPDAGVHVAEVIGDCDELAGVVIDRFRAMHPNSGSTRSPAYASGLLLAGRKVLIVGGGNVATRRIPTLLNAGAEVTLVSPEATPALKQLAEAGQIGWQQREFTDSDLDGAWYVQALTDDPGVNERVAQGAEDRHTFCVRGDDALGGSAWTPATAPVNGATLAVLGNHDHRLSRSLRDQILDLLSED